MNPEYYVWIEIEANTDTLTNPAAFRRQMEACARAGIGSVILSVKDTSGFALWESSIAPHYSQYDSRFLPKHDYLAAALKVLHSLQMRCFAAFDVFAEGNRRRPSPLMPALLHPQWQCTVYGLDSAGTPHLQPVSDPSPLSTIGSIDDFGELFVSPANPEATAYELSLIDEVLSCYDVDGIVLDRVRYVGFCSDFSAAAQQYWKARTGKSATGWPQSVYTLQGGSENVSLIPGEDYASFLTARAETVSQFIHTVHERVRRCPRPVRFLDYTGSWYPLYDSVGANWASSSYPPIEFSNIDVKAYQKTGYAEDLDTLLSGFYYPDVTEAEAERAGKPSWWYSVEGSARLAKQVTMGVVPVVGSLFLQQYSGRPAVLTRACRMCLEKSSGCMLFDLSYLESGNLWPQVGMAEGETLLLPLQKDCLQALAELWPACFPPEFQFTSSEIANRIFRDSLWMPEASFALTDSEGRLLGACACKRFPAGLPEYEGACSLSTLLVAPDAQGHGLGSQLLEAAAEAAGQQGFTKMLIGQDFGCFFSGIPAPDEDKLRFFQKRNCSINPDEHYDLEADIVQNPLLDQFDTTPFSDDFLVRPMQPQDRSALLAFLQREFPGRWVLEASEELKESGRERFFTLLEDQSGQVCGYCHVSDAGKHCGGLGPIGIAKAVRGHRVGDFLLRESLMYLRTIGIQHVLIDWTILRNYYGRFGFQPTRIYRGCIREVKQP